MTPESTLDRIIERTERVAHSHDLTLIEQELDWLDNNRSTIQKEVYRRLLEILTEGILSSHPCDL